MKRRQARHTDGRFTRNTLENTFGLRSIICPCGAINAYGRKQIERKPGGFIDPLEFNQWDVPTHCHACATPLEKEG